MAYFATHQIKWCGKVHEPGAMLSAEPIGNLPELERLGSVMYAPAGHCIGRKDNRSPWMVVKGDAEHAEMADVMTVDIVARNAALASEVATLKDALDYAESKAIELMEKADEIEAIKAALSEAESKAEDLAEALKAAEARAEAAEATAARAVEQLKKSAPKSKGRKTSGG